MSSGVYPREIVAVGLKLASAMCAVAAAALLAHPLITREAGAPPRESSPAARPTDPVAQSPEAASEEPLVEVTPQAEPPAKSAQTGIQEERADFEGSLLSLESRPSGATVWVDGTNHGETPITVGLACARGKTIRIEFSLSGFASKTHEVPCPRDSMVTVTARLTPNARSGKGKR